MHELNSSEWFHRVSGTLWLLEIINNFIFYLNIRNDFEAKRAYSILLQILVIVLIAQTTSYA